MKNNRSRPLAAQLIGLAMSMAAAGSAHADNESRPVDSQLLPMETDLAAEGRSDTEVTSTPQIAPSSALIAQTSPSTSAASTGDKGHTRYHESGSPTLDNATVNPDSATLKADANAANLPDANTSSQAKSKGFIADSSLDVLLRNYTDVFDNAGGPHRHAWVEGAQVNYQSGYTRGLAGVGIDASLFAALKLDGGQGAGNMVHVSKDGGGQNQLAWAYPGVLDIKGRISETVVKYGLQTVSNPFLVPHDNRALPPTFLGVSLASNELRNIALQAGSFTKVDPRGHTNLVDMRTSYGGTEFKRLSYVGGDWNYAPNGTMTLYADQADDVWRQYYAAVTHSIGDPGSIKWTGSGNIYSTHSQGAANQGHIDSNAYSLSVSAQHGAHGVLLGYQQILGDQFFDYVNETAGIDLVNSMDVDYNAPHERSLQLRYSIDGGYIGLPGFNAMLWTAMGWDADGSAGAAEYASPSSPQHNLYWKNGAPVQGRHHEFGFIPSYTLQSGRFKNTKMTLIAMLHVGSAHYSDNSNKELRLTVNVPIKVF